MAYVHEPKDFRALGLAPYVLCLSRPERMRIRTRHGHYFRVNAWDGKS